MVSAHISTKRSYSYYKNELLKDELLKRNYIKAVTLGKIPWKHKYKTYEDRFDNEANVTNYYALIRELEPNIVVETGTASGSMTSWILSALDRNGKGQLVSIDMPPIKGRLTMDMSIPKEDIGFLIPSEYHQRWKYMIGDSKVLLPKVLLEKDVDVFAHDSLHSRSHMLFEYNVAHCLIKPGKIILSDDILCNTAWFHFLNSHALSGSSCISNPGIGFTVNEFDEYETEIGTDVIRIN